MEWTQTHVPCPCGTSSDAYAINSNGWGTCFSCGKVFPPEVDEGSGAVSNAELYTNLSYRALNKRGIRQETCERYGYGINENNHQVAQFFDSKGRVVAQQIRKPDKKFEVRGDLRSAKMFGSRTNRGSGKMIVITEGAIDALSVNQALGGTWPVLSLKSGAAAAESDIKAELDELENYEKIVLAFDADEPGRAAVEKVFALFTPGKVVVPQYGGHKDANELLLAKGESALRSAIWDAKQWRPDGIVNLADRREQIFTPPQMGITFPWPKLNSMLYGFRPSEIVTWTAGTGIGKTAVVSEVAHHVLRGETGYDGPIGMIYLEEGVDRAGKRLVGIEMNKPIHLPNVDYTDAEFSAAFDATAGSGRVFAYDHFGSVDSTTLLNRLRYMIKSCGANVLFLDHISIVVSGNNLSDDERRTLDHLMTHLRQLTQETSACIHIVSHLRRTQNSGSHEEGMAVSLAHLRGTQAISQLSDTVISAERNQQSDDIAERNTTVLRVLKNRYAGITGPADYLLYDHGTGRLRLTDGPEDRPGETSIPSEDY